MKRLVWSHWTKPLTKETGGAWSSLKYYLLSFVLSLETARAHGLRTVLVTDDDGARMLVDSVGLRFDEVGTQLNRLEAYDHSWWNLGKILSYRIQEEPFVHLDNDVYLWRPLPDRLLTAPLLAQNPEYLPQHRDYYEPGVLEDGVRRCENGCLPLEWRWCRRLLGDHQRSFNTGVYGGHRLDFIHHCSDLIFALLDRPGQMAELNRLPDRPRLSGMLEMLIPGMCLDYHSGRHGSPFADLRIECLFPDAETAYLDAVQSGYTHLLGRSKRQPSVVSRLEARVRRLHPELYERCSAHVSRHGELYPGIR
ncbi:DUF6734 family protein [Microbispora rosea]|uniref:DUF6734 family protein n=1 Tax=Microbispora rosea TaxID=58117 RepID=UPI00344A2158